MDNIKYNFDANDYCYNNNIKYKNIAIKEQVPVQASMPVPGQAQASMPIVCDDDNVKDNWDDSSSSEEEEEEEMEKPPPVTTTSAAAHDYDNEYHYDADDYDNESEDYDYDGVDKYDKKMGRYVTAPVKKK